MGAGSDLRRGCSVESKLSARVSHPAPRLYRPEYDCSVGECVGSPQHFKHRENQRRANTDASGLGRQVLWPLGVGPPWPGSGTVPGLRPGWSARRWRYEG